MKYPKFREKEGCAYPDRDDCNYGTEHISWEKDEKTGITTIKQRDYARCEYMQFVSFGNWKCNFNKKGA